MKIGILTSGGDAPGMNAAVRAVVRSGIKGGHQIVGIMQGYRGLVNGHMTLMDNSSVANIIHRGGTILKTARCEEIKYSEGQDQAVEFIKRNNIDGLVIMGGDGTLKGAEVLHKAGIPIVFIPVTIDNDMMYTEYTIGFDTAVNTVIRAVSDIRETGMSHDKTTVIEVMGRNCGEIALRAGICGGADGILIPEIEPDIEGLIKKIKSGIERNKKNNIIIRAEGAAVSTDEISEEIKKATGEDVRKVILGYLQRGGSPSELDIYMATLMGVKAVNLLNQGKCGIALGFSGSTIIEKTLDEAITSEYQVDLEVLKISEQLI